MAEGEEKEQDQKTEEPTPKKLRDAREKGQVPLSREVNSWLMLFTGTLVFLAIFPSVMTNSIGFLRFFIEQPESLMTDTASMGNLLKHSFFETLKLLALPIILFLLTAFLAPFIQIGPLFAPESLKPSLSKIAIDKGFKRIFSQRALVEFFKGIIKLIVIALVSFFAVLPFFNGLESFIDLSTVNSLDQIRIILLRVMSAVLFVLFIVALIDILYQRSEHTKKLRMTKQEVKDEFKTTEGDPHIKAKLRQLRMEKAAERGSVRHTETADVVIMNPTHFAVALKYNPEESPAPICVAKGQDALALKIREIAQENDILIEENPPLARALYDSVSIDEMIPVEHFQAVAKIISYVFQKQGRTINAPKK